jgi:parallel beta-helix repeat protein
MIVVFVIIGLTLSINAVGKQISTSNTNNQRLVVDKNGQGDYTSIQKAIDNALSGTTIFVKNGEYSEIIEIKKQISLVGENKDSTIINPISQKNKYAVHLGAPSVRITSLSICNGAPGLYTSAVRITASGIEVRNCNIYDTPVGIAIWTSNNVVDSCYFSGCPDEGVVLLGTDYSECKGNKITRCVFNNNCDGIEMQHASSNIIENCEFYENTHSGIDAITSSNDNNIISNCKIQNNRVHGIYLSSSSGNKIIDCEISDNDGGNIVMNKYSKNNQILFPSQSELNDEEQDDEEDEINENVKPFLSRLLLGLSKLKIIKKIQMFSSFSF